MGFTGDVSVYFSTKLSFVFIYFHCLYYLFVIFEHAYDEIEYFRSFVISVFLFLHFYFSSIDSYLLGLANTFRFSCNSETDSHSVWTVFVLFHVELLLEMTANEIEIYLFEQCTEFYGILICLLLTIATYFHETPNQSQFVYIKQITRNCNFAAEKTLYNEIVQFPVHNCK